MKKYILNGLGIGIEANSKEMACLIAIINKIGIMPENLIEVEKIPSNYKILKQR
jgi:hypothetical protein